MCQKSCFSPPPVLLLSVPASAHWRSDALPLPTTPPPRSVTLQCSSPMPQSMTSMRRKFTSMWIPFVSASLKHFRLLLIWLGTDLITYDEIRLHTMPFWYASICFDMNILMWYLHVCVTSHIKHTQRLIHPSQVWLERNSIDIVIFQSPLFYYIAWLDEVVHDGETYFQKVFNTLDQLLHI